MKGNKNLSLEKDKESIPYGVGSWPEVFGNHRARIKVTEKTDAVWLHLVWRRRDPAPQDKNILILDAKTGKQVRVLYKVEINRDYADIVFRPITAPGEYHVYYMPYEYEGWIHQPATVYAPPRELHYGAWKERHGLITPERIAEGKWKTLPKAKGLEIQALSEFDRMDPMEVIATSEETRKLLEQHPESSYLLFLEDRKYPIRMTDDIPLRWIKKGPGTEFCGEAQRGESYVFQIGVYAARKVIENLAFKVSDLKSAQGHVIAGSTFCCFNLKGIDCFGRTMQKIVSVEKGKVQALWIGVQIPEDIPPGEYQGVLTMRPKDVEEKQVKLRLTVESKVIQDCGDGELWRHSRLRWLNSTIGLDEDVVAPYIPLEVQGRTVKCLGRKVQFGSTGFPESIQSGEREILAKPIVLMVKAAEGVFVWKEGKVEVLKSSKGVVEWRSHGSSGPFAFESLVKMEFDGYIHFDIKITAEKEVNVKDVILEIPIRREVATYMTGLGRKGGYRPSQWQCSWDAGNVAKSKAWIGDVEAGLQCKFHRDVRDVLDSRVQGILSSWSNDGRGGCAVREEDQDAVVVQAYSGERNFRQGEEVQFCFGLLVTPVKPLDFNHWNWRYFHGHGALYSGKVALNVDTAKQFGVNIINVDNMEPSYFNYPFLVADQLTAYVKQAHRKGLKVKFYYNGSGISNQMVELWALRSLGHEVFPDGPGGGYSWFREHLVSDYGAGWHTPYPDGGMEASTGTVGLSSSLWDSPDQHIPQMFLGRWYNYYLEGVAWLLRNCEIDGVYLDSLGFDREVMKRLRKVIDRERAGGLIDLHSGNAFIKEGLSPANEYMEYFPYIDSLWFGEGYDYDESPDYWLVEISGIPFGLFGEMLQGGGNQWRGMLYGITSRLGWFYSDPRPVWKIWDNFGIKDAQMIGYWERSCPIKTNHKDILATAYCKKDKVLLSIASWAKELVHVQLKIDWKAIGLDPEKANLFAPDIPGFQEEALFRPAEKIPVAPRRGWLLIISETKDKITNFA